LSVEVKCLSHNKLIHSVGLALLVSAYWSACRTVFQLIFWTSPQNWTIWYDTGNNCCHCLWTFFIIGAV